MMKHTEPRKSACRTAWNFIKHNMCDHKSNMFIMAISLFFLGQIKRWTSYATVGEFFMVLALARQLKTKTLLSTSCFLIFVCEGTKCIILESHKGYNGWLPNDGLDWLYKDFKILITFVAFIVYLKKTNFRMLPQEFTFKQDAMTTFISGIVLLKLAQYVRVMLMITERGQHARKYESLLAVATLIEAMAFIPHIYGVDHQFVKNKKDSIFALFIFLNGLFLALHWLPISYTFWSISQEFAIAFIFYIIYITRFITQTYVAYTNTNYFTKNTDKDKIFSLSNLNTLGSTRAIGFSEHMIQPHYDNNHQVKKMEDLC